MISKSTAMIFTLSSYLLKIYITEDVMLCHWFSILQCSKGSKCFQNVTNCLSNDSE